MFDTLSDPYLQFAFWTGAGALILALALAVQIVVLRIRLGRNMRREKTCIACWRPVLNAASMGMAPDVLPHLHRRERLLFLKLWIHLMESVRGDAGDALRDIARKLQCDAIAHKFLRRSNRAQQLLAILVLGHLRDRDAWNDLQELAAADDSATSLNALWALVQIDPVAATSQLMSLFIRRDDWSLLQVGVILQDAREACAPELAKALSDAQTRQVPRILGLAEALRVQLPVSLLNGLLQTESADILTGALRLASNPQLLELARAHLAHPDWRVRVQVAKTLGRIGNRSDVSRLKELLNDRHWWVRYRAAHALVDLPFLNRADMEALPASLSDRYAQDILRQVLVEKAWL